MDDNSAGEGRASAGRRLGALVRVHAGRWSGYRHQREVRGLCPGPVVWIAWKPCVTDSGESSSNMYATPPGSMAIVRVQGIVRHRGLQRGERTGRVVVRVQGGDRLRRATSCKLRRWILRCCLFL